MSAKGVKNFPDVNFSDMKSEDILAADTSNSIAVLPMGATEQHGPHLPVETDSIIAAGIVKHLIDNLPQKLAVTFLPVEKVGYSPEHLDYPNSLSLDFDEAINRWIGIGEHLSSLGIQKLVLLNAHGGNSALMTIVATELRTRFDMLCVTTSWTRFGKPEGMYEEAELAIDIHGGDIETSVMLAFEPELVEMKKAKKFNSQQTKLLKQNKYLHAYGRHAFGWKMQDLNPTGVTGNAKLANAKKGETLIKHSVSGLVQLLKEVDRFDMKIFERKAEF